MGFLVVICCNYIYYFACIHCEPRFSGSSHRKCSVRKGVLRNFAKFTGNHMFQSLFFNKIAGLSRCFLIRHRCFTINFEKFLRTSSLQTNSGRLLLIFYSIYHLFKRKTMPICQLFVFFGVITISFKF